MTQAQEKIETTRDMFDGKTSVKGKRWNPPVVDDARIAKLVDGHGLPEMVARLLVLRNLDGADMDGFLNPTLSNHFPDPMRLKNLSDACDFLAEAIQSNRTIGILAKGFDELKAAGCDIVVVLDSGITSIAPITHAKSIGLDVIVVDHHEPDEKLPNANFIINPKLRDDDSGYDYLAAVGVTFLLCVGLNAKLRAAGYYDGQGEPSLKDLLDLVALGTICDMVPLEGAKRQNVGLRALLDVSKIKGLPDPYHAGFMLGPRINAGSRVHQSDLAAQLLSTEDEGEATRLAWLLDDCNEKRKTIQKDMTREAVEKAKAYLIEHPDANGLVIDGHGWHSGLSGLVSGAIKDKFGKPSCVVTYVENENGIMEGRASGRSVEGIHIAEIFLAAQNSDLLIKGGGHAMAGGFTIEPDKLDEFRTFFSKQVAAQARQSNNFETDGDDIELMMAVQSLNLPTAKLLIESLAPFGMGNPEPKTILSNVHIHYADQVGVNHLRCTVKDAEGGQTIKCMAFRAFDADLGKTLRELAGSGRPVHLKGQVKINEWQGRESVEYHVGKASIYGTRFRNISRVPFV
jgi:single-stranded-DNA-specific exonuclease